MKKNSEIISNSLLLSQNIYGNRASFSHVLAAAKNMISTTKESKKNLFTQAKVLDGEKFVSNSVSESKITNLNLQIENFASKTTNYFKDSFPKSVKEKLQFSCNMYGVYFQEMFLRFQLLPDAEGKIFEKSLEAFLALFKSILLLLELNSKKEEKQEATTTNFFLPEIPKPKLSSPKVKRTKQNVSRRENELELENAKLEAQISQFLAQIKELEEGQALGYLQKEKEDLRASCSSLQKQNNDLKDAYESVTSQNKISILNLKSSLQRTEKELKALEKAHEKALFRLQELETENASYKENIIVYREVALMEHEELNSICTQFLENKQMLARFKERAASLQSRLDNLLNSNPDQIEIPSELSRADKDILMPLRQSLLESPIFVKKITKREEISNLSLKDETVKMMISRPSFSLLIENKLKSYMSQTQENPNKVSLLFLATLRGILDSKMNECFLHRQTPKLFSKFVDFAYSWLGMFEVNAKSRKVQHAEHTGSADDIRAMFLIDLSNQRLDRLWECVNFKEFFKEEFPQDELYFFLVCRHILFKGTQLQHSNGSFELIHYIHLEYAEELAKTVLERYDKAQILFALSKLKEKSKRKGVNLFVDSAFVLRVLLEYYKSEKQIRLGMIRDLFYTQPTIEISGKASIQFHSFKKIIDANFPSVTDIEKSELYRDAFSVGEGSVNAESFYTAAIENGFFIKVLKIPNFLKLPVELTSDKQKIIPESSLGLAATVMLNNIGDKFHVMNFANSRLSELGLEELMKEWKSLQTIQNSLFQISKLDFKFEGIFDYNSRINELWGKILNISVINTHSRGDIEDVKVVQTYVKHWDENFEVFKRLCDDEALVLIEQNSKAKKLQNFIKKRISKWYMLMNQIFTSKLKKTLGNKLKS